MTIIKKEYVSLNGCVNFFAWLWFTADYPFGSMYGADRANWFKYCGSDNRLRIRRRFGFSQEIQYHRNEFGALYNFLYFVRFIGICILLCELSVILAYNFS